jgi:hypothetical protein
MWGKKTVGVLAALVIMWVIAQSGDADEPERASTSSAEATRAPTPSSTPTGPDSSTPTATPAPEKTAPASPTSSPAQRTHRRGTALVALAALPVKGRAPMTGYDRDRFGYAWLDADRNGCDTRNDILDRDLTGKAFEAGTGGCVVLSGVLADPYTGTDIRFARGGGDEVDIDHVVALGNAWATGAFRWDVKKRAALANDPLELLAVDFRSNRQKSDGDAATWLPSHRSFRCAYVARQVTVKAKYGLWVTPPEKAAMQRVLAGCPDQPLTTDRWHAATRVDHDITDPGAPGASTGGTAASSAPRARTKPRPLTGGSVYYENCDAARTAGAAPVHRGDPGYDDHLDRDGDGTGCE